MTTKTNGGAPPPMRMTYDPAADALMIELAPDMAVAKTQRVTALQRLDLDANGNLVGVEILKASSAYPREVLLALDSPDEELTLAECEEEVGVAAATLRRQIMNGRLKGRKHGRDWLVKGSDLWTYMENRAPAGRRSPKERARPSLSHSAPARARRVRGGR